MVSQILAVELVEEEAHLAAHLAALVLFFSDTQSLYPQ
jgi:hypothetical protein